MRNLLALAAALTLAGCAAQPTDPVGAAIATPLADLNLVHAPIPEVLAAAARAPYDVPADTGCAPLRQATRALDEVLGPDLDAPASEADPGLVERGGALAGQAATGALQRTAEGVIPFRGWVRRLSGAERYSRQVAAAIAAGTARRAFLRGIAAARGCS